MVKHIIEARCDNALLCAFDPKALPEAFDSYRGKEVHNTLEDLQIENRFRNFETGPNGDFVCHVYVNEEALLERTLRARVYHQSDFIPIECPSGRLWFCGAEFVANEPMKGNALTPVSGLSSHKMGKSIRLKHGTHKMRITRIDNHTHRDGLAKPLDWGLIGQVGGTLLSLILAFFAMVSTIGLIASIFSWVSISVFGPDNCRCSLTLEEAHQQIQKMLLFLAMSSVMLFFTHKTQAALPVPKSSKEKRKLDTSAYLQIPDFVFEIVTEGHEFGLLAAQESRPFVRVRGS